MKGLKFLLGGAMILLVAACGDRGETETADPMTVKAASSDMTFFELVGDVKEATKVVYYDVKLIGDTISMDTTASKRALTTVYFDDRGHYIVKEYEKIRRDDQGRIVRWENRRPNAGIHGGFLKDTLAYDYDSPNVLTVKGMGETTTVVRDENGNIVGQQSIPFDRGSTSMANNVVLATDDRGNWTERLTVWTVMAPGRAPHVSYTLDRRTIKYYK